MKAISPYVKMLDNAPLNSKTLHISDFVCKITLQMYNLYLEPAVLGKKQEVT